MKPFKQNLDTILSRSTIHNNNIFEGKPFYCEWTNYLEKDYCSDINPRCFQHIIGLPVKGTTRPLYDWQHTHLFDNLEEHKYNWILKATGLGVSEITLRWILWRCLVNDDWSNGIVCLLTGPNIDLAKRLIARSYDMIQPHIPNAKVNDYKLMVNGTEIGAFPGKNVDSARSLTNVRLVVLEEADFFSKGEQEDARKIAERYIGKSDSRILIISTPGAPGGLMESIQNEPNSLYNKIRLDYTLGLNNIFSQSEIDEAKRSKSFEQEYGLKYSSGVGSIFSGIEIDACIEEYNIPTNGSRHFISYAGIDPGYGSSSFGIVVLAWIDNCMKVVETHNIANILYTDSLRLIDEIIARWGICKLYIDASGSHIIRQLCDTYQSGAYKNYELLTADQLKRFRHSACRSPLVVPIPFSTEHKNMMRNLQESISLKTIRIHPQFDELITALKSAQSKEGDQYSLDKSKSANNDLLDGLRLALESVNQ